MTKPGVGYKVPKTPPATTTYLKSSSIAYCLSELFAGAQRGDGPARNFFLTRDGSWRPSDWDGAPTQSEATTSWLHESAGVYRTWKLVAWETVEIGSPADPAPWVKGIRSWGPLGWARHWITALGSGVLEHLGRVQKEVYLRELWVDAKSFASAAAWPEVAKLVNGALVAIGAEPEGVAPGPPPPPLDEVREIRLHDLYAYLPQDKAKLLWATLEPATGRDFERRLEAAIWEESEEPTVHDRLESAIHEATMALARAAAEVRIHAGAAIASLGCAVTALADLEDAMTSAPVASPLDPPSARALEDLRYLRWWDMKSDAEDGKRLNASKTDQESKDGAF